MAANTMSFENQIKILVENIIFERDSWSICDAFFRLFALKPNYARRKKDNSKRLRERHQT
jgi:hypothetical protein